MKNTNNIVVTKLKIFAFILFIGMAMLVMYNCTSLFTKERENLSYYSNSFHNVKIEGQYKINDGEWMELNDEPEFNLNEYNTYYIKGHFTKNIDKNHEVMMRSKDLYIRMNINDEHVMAVGFDKEHSMGNMWVSFVSDGITTDDEVEIEVSNIYTGVNTSAVSDLLDSIYFGSVDGLYNIAFKQNGMDLVLGFVIISLGLCELLAAIIMTFLNAKSIDRIVYSGGFTCMAGIWIGIRYNIISLIIPYPMLIQSVEIISLDLLCLFLSLYLNTYLNGKLRIAGLINCISIIAGVIVTVLLKAKFNIDMYRYFRMTTILAIINIIIFIGYLSYEYFAKKNKSVRIMIFFVLPMFAGGLIDGVRFWMDIGNGPIALSKGILSAGIIQLLILIYEKNENDKIIEKARVLENELIQSRISVMLSQIQPHFLYNSLNTIRYLCIEDPEKAEQAVIDFASFLRGNVDSLNSTGLITFEKELDHVKHYLSLEKNRFGDRVNVEYRIGVDKFLLPPLTIQPIVENAVRYGITKKEEGGTVTIKTSETEKEYEITIYDDGVGFDANAKPAKDDKRTHVGIENVRKRLQDQCNGSLTIYSMPNKGTVVKIKIAKEK